MPPSPSTSSIDWDAKRAAYAARFGTLCDVLVTTDPHAPPFWILVFREAARPAAPFVYATFGAPFCEVYVAATIPSYGVRVALEKVAATTQPLPELPAVVREHAAWTPFFGFLALPMREGGSFTVPTADGAESPVYRLVPLTVGERAFARESPEGALRGLEAADALLSDPLRDCTVDPSDTRLFRRVCAPNNVRSLRAILAKLAGELAALRARGASQEAIENHEGVAARNRVALEHHEARLPKVPTEAEEWTAMTTGRVVDRYRAAIDAVTSRGIDALGDLPVDWELIEHFIDTIHLVVLTHPEQRPLLDAIVLGRDAEPPESIPTSEAVDRVGNLLLEAVALITTQRPDCDPSVLAARVRDRLAVPAASVDGLLDEDEPPFNVAWFACVRAIYEEIFPKDSPVRPAFRVAASTVIGEVRKHADMPPFERLCKLSVLFARLFTTGYIMPLALRTPH